MLIKLNVPFLGIVKAGFPCLVSNGTVTYLKQIKNLGLNLSLTLTNKELTEHNIWPFTSGRPFPTEFVPFELKKTLNLFSVQKLQGAYSLFGDNFLRFSVQKLLIEGGTIGW